MTSDGCATFVAANSALRPVPEVPEISLYAADDAFSLWEAVERKVGQSDQPPPFWAFAWPGGQALARYVLDHPEQVAGRRVLDLGSGSGLTAIACARAGASAVLASELDPFAVAAIELNATANDVSIAVTGDVLGGTGEDAQVVLAADIWYEQRLAQRALGLLQRARARGADVLIGDIGRTFLPRSLMRERAAYDVPVIADLEDAAVKRVLVLTLR
ncbi:MAG TPA: 50S ribosomal protein L11 methyltransferase [Streptosporangiaceae bacterium]|nr:50S ribosomal protein L11 methyltransferase [Streptosporangiaceae bacterium]